MKVLNAYIFHRKSINLINCYIFLFFEELPEYNKMHNTENQIFLFYIINVYRYIKLPFINELDNYEKKYSNCISI